MSAFISLVGHASSQLFFKPYETYRFGWEMDRFIPF